MADEPLHSLTDLWNGGSTTFYAIKMNVTDTASAADSKLMELQVGGVSQWSVSKGGNVVATGNFTGVNGVFSGTMAVTGAASAASLTLTTDLAVAEGGTGASTASAARTNLGATSLGGDLFTTANAAAARTSLGATATGGAVFTAADAAAARTALALGTLATLSSADTANITDDAVTNAKLANMAQATIKGRAAGAGTGDPVDLTAAQVQTIIGSWVTLSEQVASNVAGISITGIPSNAKVVEIYFDNVAPVTNTVNLRLRTSADGATYDSGASDYRYTQLRSTVGASPAEVGSEADSSIILTSTIGNTAGRYVQGVVTLHNPGQAGYRTGLNYQTDGVNSSGAGVGSTGGAHRRADAVVVAVQFSFTSGNINTGRFVARYFV